MASRQVLPFAHTPAVSMLSSHPLSDFAGEGRQLEARQRMGLITPRVLAAVSLGGSVLFARITDSLTLMMGGYIERTHGIYIRWRAAI